jgi:putative PIN family toxin of toxin-antitoxin system
MIKIIVDTNILISASLTGRHPEAVILSLVSNPDFMWVVSEGILAEYKAVLMRKKLKLSTEQQQRWLKIIDAFTTTIDVNISVDFPRDPKDAKFLECAIASNADYLVTGDRDFDDISDLQNTQVVSASRFLEIVELRRKIEE